MTSPRTLIVVVTYNSQAVLSRCVNAIRYQNVNDYQVVIVDSGSVDPSYVDGCARVLLDANRVCHVIKSPANIGFAAANNVGLRGRLNDFEYVMFLNPDAFLFPDALKSAGEELGKAENARIGVAQGWLYGFDSENDHPTGRMDSVGIARTWYGRTFDIAQGIEVKEISDKLYNQKVVAACGALMLCRSTALLDLGDRADAPFNEDFFMYKEDIELSLVLQTKGWHLRVFPQIKAYHCRGWNKNRAAVSHRFRLMSARNELKLTISNKSLYSIYALSKYLYVRYLER